VYIFTATPTVGSTSTRPLGAGCNIPSCPSSPPGACGEWKAGRAASKLKLENETGDHSLTSPSVRIAFPPGEPLERGGKNHVQ
jgi:hypothetical protein